MRKLTSLVATAAAIERRIITFVEMKYYAVFGKVALEDLILGLLLINLIKRYKTLQIVKSSASLTGSTSTTTATLSTLGGINSGSGPHTTDLRPTWAKQPNVAEAQVAALQNANTVTASSRDFPSLAAATAVIAKQSSNALTESLKPQSLFLFFFSPWISLLTTQTVK